jgi:hypothetical protein
LFSFKKEKASKKIKSKKKQKEKVYKNIFFFFRIFEF